MPLRNHAYSSSLGRSESRPSSFPDQHFELVTELLDVGDVGSDGAVVERADGGAGAALGYVEDRVEILLAAMAGQDALAHLVDPARGLAARRALAARLVSVEAGHHHERLGDRYGLVEHDDARRAGHRSRVPEPVDVHRDVDLVGAQDRCRGSALHDAFEAAVSGDAAGPSDEVAQRDADRLLVDARPLDPARHRVDAGAAHGLRPEAGEPGGAAIDDVRHLRDRLDVVHDRRHAEGALDGGEGRLDLRPALLALERRDQARLLAADEAPGAPGATVVEAGPGRAAAVGAFTARPEGGRGLAELPAEEDDRLPAPAGPRGT